MEISEQPRQISGNPAGLADQEDSGRGLSPEEIAAFARRIGSIIPKGSSINAFAKKAGVNESLLRKYIAGESLPGLEKLIAIARTSGVRVEWLATGEGPTRPDDGTAQAQPTDSSPVLTADHVYVPLFDVTASAGGGAVVEAELVEDTLAFKRSWLLTELRVRPEDLALVHVEGESMEPTLRPGDLILVNRSDTSVRDGIYLLRLNSALLVKRLQWLPGGKLKVASDNPAYEPFIVSMQDESQDLAIVGRIVWSGRRM
jgi:phage repressor protein C with HTH and peptisase S24 domain